MINQGAIRKAMIGAVLAGAVSLTSLLGGIANAETPSVSEIVVMKLPDTTVSLGGPDTIVYTGLESQAAGESEWRYVNVRRFDGPAAGAGNEVGMETITIAHEAIDLH